MFPKFDKAAAIAAYNQQRRTNYSASEGFGCAHLATSMLELAEKAATCLEQPHLMHWWTLAELAYLKQRHARLREWQAAQRAGDATTAWPRLPTDENIAAPLREKCLWHGWLSNLCQLLAQPGRWAQWQQHASMAKKLRLKSLRLQWQQQHLLMRTAHAAVLEISQALLPSLIAHHQHGKRLPWHKRRRVPRPIYASYQAHCENFLAAATTLQQQLVKTMLLRLEALDNSGFRHSDPALHFYQQLQQCGATALPAPPPKCLRPLNNEEFNAFHAYALAHGNEKAWQRLQKLPWLKPGAPLPLQIVAAKNGGHLAPECFIKDVPQQQLFFAWLRKGAALRQQFFQSRGLLLAQLNHLPGLNAEAGRLPNITATEHYLQACGEKMDLIEQELKALQGPAYQGLSALWQRRARRFLTQWQTLLLAQRKHLLIAQFRIAEHMANVLATNQRSLSKGAFPWQAAQLLKALLGQAEKNLAAAPDEELCQRLQAIKAKAQALLSAHQALSWLAQLPQGRALATHQLEHLFAYDSATRSYDSSAHAAFRAHCSPLLQQALLSIKAKLKPSSGQSQQAIQQNCAYLLSATAALQKLGGPELQQALANLLRTKLPYYFLFYLQAHCANEANTATLAHLAEALACLGQAVEIAGQTISAHAAALSERRQATSTKVHAQILLEKTLEHLLLQNLAKDTAAFDQQLLDCLQNCPQLRYSTATLETLIKIRNQMVKEGAQTIEELATPLSSYERALLSLAGQKKSFANAVPQLLALSAKAHQVAIALKQPAPAQQKFAIAHDLGEHFQQTLSAAHFAALPLGLGQGRTGKRRLFTCPTLPLEKKPIVISCPNPT